MKNLLLIGLGLLMAIVSCDKDDKVEPSTPDPEEIVVSGVKETLVLQMNGTCKIQASIVPEEANQTINFMSSDCGVASVDDKGLVTALGYGECYIELSSVNDLTKRINVKVSQIKPESVSLSSENLTIRLGSTVNLTHKILPEDAISTVTYSIEDEDIVSLENEVLTGLKMGETDVIVTTMNDLADTCHVKVVEKVTGQKITFHRNGTADSHITLGAIEDGVKVIVDGKEYSVAKEVLKDNGEWNQYKMTSIPVKANSTIVIPAESVFKLTYIRLYDCTSTDVLDGFDNLRYFYDMKASFEDFTLFAPNLESIVFYYPKTMGAIKLPESKNLRDFELACANNVASLDLSNFKKLKRIHLFECFSLTSLEIPNRDIVEYIDVTSTLIKELDVTNCPKLNTFRAILTPMAVYDFSGTNVSFMEIGGKNGKKFPQKSIVIDPNTTCETAKIILGTKDSGWPVYDDLSKYEKGFTISYLINKEPNGNGVFVDLTDDEQKIISQLELQNYNGRKLIRFKQGMGLWCFNPQKKIWEGQGEISSEGVTFTYNGASDVLKIGATESTIIKVNDDVVTVDACTKTDDKWDAASLTQLQVSKGDKIFIPESSSSKIEYIEFWDCETDDALQGFDNIQYINLQNYNKTSFALIGDNKLKHLLLDDAVNLNSMDLSNLSNLEELVVTEALIPTYDISHMTKLKIVDFQSCNKVTELVVPNKNVIVKVNVAGTNVAALDVKDCPELEEVRCQMTKIESLDFTGCNKCWYMNIGGLIEDKSSLKSVVFNPTAKKGIVGLYFGAGFATYDDLLKYDEDFSIVCPINIEPENGVFSPYTKPDYPIIEALEKQVYNGRKCVQFKEGGKAWTYNAESEAWVTDDEPTVVYAESVTLNEESLDLTVGKTFQLTETVLPVDAVNKECLWSSDDDAVVTVSQDGLVTAVAAGSANVTAMPKGQQETGTVIFATCAVTVSEAGEVTCVDPDGRSYKTVKIGEQVWMAENYAYLPKINKRTDMKEKYYKYYSVYGYEGSDLAEAKETDNYKKYGVIYSQAAVKFDAPEGWHLPTDAEWKELERAIGMSEAQANSTTARGKFAGKLLSSEEGGTDDYGFGALLGGHRMQSYFFSKKLGEEVVYLTKDGSSYKKVVRVLKKDGTIERLMDMNVGHGGYVRFVKDK